MNPEIEAYKDLQTSDNKAICDKVVAILFIISQIFKKGIELQNENDLTV
jgi:hypothetical protein